jgi:hypothetical protein
VLTLPLGLFSPSLLVVPAGFAALQLAAILFNELRYKRKPLREALCVLPVQVLYYATRTASALWTRARIAAGLERAIRESRVAARQRAV